MSIWCSALLLASLRTLRGRVRPVIISRYAAMQPGYSERADGLASCRALRKMAKSLKRCPQFPLMSFDRLPTRSALETFR